MQLFVYISGNPEVVPPLMSELLSKGIHGATSVDCKGMLRIVGDSNVEAPPAFGALRHLLNPEYQSGKMIFILLRDEDVPLAKEATHKICGDLRLPNTGVSFSVPVMNWEGVSHKE